MKAGPERLIHYSCEAFRHLSYFRAFEQRIIDDGVTEQLAENDPGERTRHKHELGRPVGEATHQVEIRKWRMLYQIEQTQGAIVSTILVIGEKHGNKLFVEGKEFPT